MVVAVAPGPSAIIESWAACVLFEVLGIELDVSNHTGAYVLGADNMSIGFPTTTFTSSTRGRSGNAEKVRQIGEVHSTATPAASLERIRTHKREFAG